MIDHALLLQVDTQSFKKFSGRDDIDNNIMYSVDELPWAWAFSDYRPKKKADVPCRIAPIKPCQPPMQSTDAIRSATKSEAEQSPETKFEQVRVLELSETRIIYVEEAEKCNRIHYSDWINSLCSNWNPKLHVCACMCI